MLVETRVTGVAGAAGGLRVFVAALMSVFLFGASCVLFTSSTAEALRLRVVGGVVTADGAGPALEWRIWQPYEVVVFRRLTKSEI